MLIRVLIYTSIIALFLLETATLHSLFEIGFYRKPYILLVLFIAYVVLLFWELKSCVAKGKGYEETMKNGVIFSVLVGIISGVFLSYPEGFKAEVPPLLFMITVFLGFIGYGLSKGFWEAYQWLQRREKS